LVTLFLFITLSLSQHSAAQRSEKSQEIDNYVNEVSNEYGIPGVALAIVKDGEVIHKNEYGFANLEHEVPISNNSIFRVYSLTKLVVTTGVFQLIEQEKLHLEDPISKYVSSLPEAWHSVQLKHLLTHSSGLPNIPRFPVIQNLSEAEATAEAFAQEIEFSPGAEYSYNQTNFWLLKEILESVTDQPIEYFLISNQFSATPDTAFFSSDSRDIIRHRVTAYFPFTKGYPTIDHPFLQGDYGYAMNGLNITLDEFINWSQSLRTNKLIKKETKETMWQPFAYSQSNKSFTYGWDRRVVHSRVSYGFSGSLVTAFRVFPEDDISIIFLGNGLGEFFDIEDIVNHITGILFE